MACLELKVMVGITKLSAHDKSHEHKHLVTHWKSNGTNSLANSICKQSCVTKCAFGTFKEFNTYSDTLRSEVSIKKANGVKMCTIFNNTKKTYCYSSGAK